jgi:hypothetical protein
MQVRAGFKKIISAFSSSGEFGHNYLGKKNSLLFCFKQTGGRFLAFYTLVFQAYLEVFFFAIGLSHFFGFGHANFKWHC